MFARSGKICFYFDKIFSKFVAGQYDKLFNAKVAEVRKEERKEEPKEFLFFYIPGAFLAKSKK
jgi:hypothetical protein